MHDFRWEILYLDAFGGSKKEIKMIETRKEYTIASDDLQWILIWHPKGAKYNVDKNGDDVSLPRGKMSYFGKLYDLTYHLLDVRARRCETLEELKGKLGGFVEEMRSINLLESARESIVNKPLTSNED